MNGFVDIDYAQVYKNREMIGGDVFLLSRRDDDGRVISTLSDGLGSGVKAHVLANLTATMAQKYMMNSIDIKRSATIIMNTLPVCSERKISYSTFTLMDMTPDGNIRIVEYDNPECLLFKGTEYIQLQKDAHDLPERIAYKKDTVYYSETTLSLGDRVILFSDGVTQSGMGSKTSPLGWRMSDIITYINTIISAKPEISSRELAGKIVTMALSHDIHHARDDITCGVVYYRKPRHTMLVTGPPFEPSNDSTLMKKIRDCQGRIVISGGTTASIVARETGQAVEIDMKSRSPEVPPLAYMKGIDLVTEGMLTLSYCASLVEDRNEESINREHNAAAHLARLLLDSDTVQCVVGTRINEAHQNPDMPVDLGIRRTLVNRLVRALENNYLKKTSIEYI